MLKEFSTRTTLPASDIARARRFYEEVLGLEPIQVTPDGVVYESGAADAPTVPGWAPRSTFLLSAARDVQRGNQNQMGFFVRGIEEIVARLQSRGVVFEEFHPAGSPSPTVVVAIQEGRGRLARFKDSEGNILGLVQYGG